MKNLLFAFFISGIFFSCKGSKDQSAKDSIGTDSLANTQEALIKKFGPIIQGVWVEKGYIDKLGETKSPIASTDFEGYISSMKINVGQNAVDSITVPAIWGNHEGGDTRLIFKPGKQKNTLLFRLGEQGNLGELAYSIENNDTILTTYLPDEKRKGKFFISKYIKIFNTNAGNEGEGLYYAVNKKIISGNYASIDSTGKNMNIIFTNDGKLTGIPDLNGYSINIDFDGGPPNNMDEISFLKNEKVLQSYTFKIKADTLKLYETRLNADSTEYILDKLKYKLVRQKK